MAKTLLELIIDYDYKKRKVNDLSRIDDDYEDALRALNFAKIDLRHELDGIK